MYFKEDPDAIELAFQWLCECTSRELEKDEIPTIRNVIVPEALALHAKLKKRIVELERDIADMERDAAF